jgi:hypothetical protein
MLFLLKPCDFILLQDRTIEFLKKGDSAFLIPILYGDIST